MDDNTFYSVMGILTMAVGVGVAITCISEELKMRRKMYEKGIKMKGFGNFMLAYTVMGVMCTACFLYCVASLCGRIWG